MRLLNIGAGPRGIPVPPWWAGWEIVRLDIEPQNDPDLLMDAMALGTLEPGQFDAAYASHLLEHLYPMQLGEFLAGVRHVLTDDGFFEARVPNLLRACEQIARAGRVDAACYQSAAGLVTAWDMLYGYLPFQERYGTPMAHHNGFSPESLSTALRSYGFARTYVQAGEWEIGAFGCKTDLPDEMKRRIGIDRATGDSPVHPDDGGADVEPVRLVRAVAELPLRQPPGREGGRDTPAAPAPRGRGTQLPRAAGLGGRL